MKPGLRYHLYLILQNVDRKDDTVALLKRRVVDVAGCLGSDGRVLLDGNQVQFKTFEGYVNNYIGTTAWRLYKKLSDKLQVCVCLSDGKFEQVSFVNYIWTRKGGAHVDCVTTGINELLCDSIKVDPSTLKTCFWVFVNARWISDPVFDSQTKENLITTDKKLFRSKLKSWFSREFTQTQVQMLKDIAYPLLFARKGGEKLRIEGLDDAHFAGTDKAGDCTLILTEGESAAKIAKNGLSIVGQDYYGIYAMRGKLLNVREAAVARVRKSTPIQNIMKILGLQDHKHYDNVDDLRYGHLMIMADMDYDGNHVRGLLINFFHSLWPSLVQVPNFMRAYMSPIVRASKASNKNDDDDVLYFYTIPEYDEWQIKNGKDVVAEYSIKYFKGLGASEDEETFNLFANLSHFTVNFVWVDEDDDKAIDLAFSRKRSGDRKTWLKNHQVGTSNYSNRIRLQDFINKDIKEYFLYDLQRSIPSMVDGLKPGQRKVLHSAFTMPIPCEENGEIDLDSFAGYVRQNSVYRHGVDVTAGVIVKMARNYVGSNNINLLHPICCFGSRNKGGKDSANFRYIKTRLSTITPYLYLKKDECLLCYLIEDGKCIQPTWFLPIIPMVLVNGCRGIGTGWNTHIPNHNPRVILSDIRKLLRNEGIDAMDPWYEGFSGTITRSKKNQFTTKGKVDIPEEQNGQFYLTITELPIGKWTKDYMNFLEEALNGETPFFEITSITHLRTKKCDLEFA